MEKLATQPPSESNLTQGQTASLKPEAGSDREVWVRDQILTAIRMAIALDAATNCGADRTAFAHAVRGVANGAAIEILATLGFSRKFTNLPTLTPDVG